MPELPWTNNSQLKVLLHVIALKNLVPRAPQSETAWWVGPSCPYSDLWCLRTEENYESFIVFPEGRWGATGTNRWGNPRKSCFKVQFNWKKHGRLQQSQFFDVFWKHPGGNARSEHRDRRLARANLAQFWHFIFPQHSTSDSSNTATEQRDAKTIPMFGRVWPHNAIRPHTSFLWALHPDLVLFPRSATRPGQAVHLSPQLFLTNVWLPWTTLEQSELGNGGSNLGIKVGWLTNMTNMTKPVPTAWKCQCPNPLNVRRNFVSKIGVKCCDGLNFCSNPLCVIPSYTMLYPSNFRFRKFHQCFCLIRTIEPSQFWVPSILSTPFHG